jgi:hypothetical protein
MSNEWKNKLAAFSERGGAFWLVLTALSLASLAWGVWFSTSLMPQRLYRIASTLGVLSSVFGVLFGLARQPQRPLALGVMSFSAGWILVGANYLVANTMDSVSRSFALIVDLYRIVTLAGFFLCFALSLAVCVRVISPSQGTHQE